MPPLTRRIRIQLAIFGVVALVGGAVMVFGYIRLPAMFGIGRYRVTVELPQAAGLYASGNVTYRGTEVGRVENVRLTKDRRRGGAVAEVGHRHSVGSRSPGAQPVGGG